MFGECFESVGARAEQDVAERALPGGDVVGQEVSFHLQGGRRRESSDSNLSITCESSSVVLKVTVLIRKTKVRDVLKWFVKTDWMHIRFVLK